ncbi:MAG: zinc ribbon domain-containing protein, partial [Planctomycetota bacterium]
MVAACKTQCSYCMEVINASEKMIGRNILCPMCDTKLKIAPPSDGDVFLSQDFSEALQKFKLNNWDSAIASKAYELEMASDKRLRKAIGTIRLKARKNVKVALNEELLSNGAIDKSANLALCELVKGAVTTEKQVKMKECPNCFGSIPESSDNCKFCGQELGDLMVMDMCPNCKREQPEGKKLCNACGADMATGLKPGAGRGPKCPRCRAPLIRDAEICTVCRTKLSRYRKKSGAVKAATGIKDWLSVNAGTIFFAVILIGGIYAASNWEKLMFKVNAILENPQRAALYARVDAMDKALEFADLDAIQELIDPSYKKKVTEKTRTAILSGENRDGVVDHLDARMKHDYEFSKDEK